MLAARDLNRVPVAPSVKIPTLGFPSGGDTAAKATSYSPPSSMKHRFSDTWLPGAFTIPAGASPLPPAELCVYECSTGAAAVEEWPPSREWGEGSGFADDSKLYNEQCRLEESVQERGVALQTTPGDVLPELPSVTALTGLQTNLPTGELLLQKEDFLERLVQRVRASCASLVRDHATGTSGVEHNMEPGAGSHRGSSPLPRRSSPRDAEAADGTQGRSSDAGRRLIGLSRSRSPSPKPASSMAKRMARGTAAGRVQAQADTLVARVARAAESPLYQRSSAASPDPRPPSTDLYATGGALRSSLQHSRCSGVSRGRRSLSAERPEHSDACAPLAAQVRGVEEGEVASAWGRVPTAGIATPGAAGRRSLSNVRSESVHSQFTHPQWNPHPIQVARPAWNQRQPQRKQRPLVSAPGSQPPSSARRCASRSPETSSNARGLRGARSEERDATGASLPNAENVLKRTASASLQVRREQATVPRRASGQPSRATVASPLSPPSARALFQSHDAPSAAQTTPPRPGREAALQSQCDGALARATRAEQKCNLLSHALEQLLVDHAADKAAWEARQAALEQRLASIMEWISSIDAEATLDAASQGATNALVPEAVTSETATPHLLRQQSEAGAAARPTATTVTKSTAWEGDVNIVDISNNGGHSVDTSPLPGAPGTTPTPARPHSANADSRSASTCQVRLPPSPPLILHMHAAAAQSQSE
ncbi:hypothetical protein LSCM1_03581 [Leishmania martiniquensis]|uniref:Uncharacterized protein n=1 Tax=Leishmania martiniquensis TaxID=1580590 RepID=A0A836KIH3_9TRYP|nr:hypothetical protein LSCM1_03581 [Leishmania martiniquensis]